MQKLTRIMLLSEPGKVLEYDAFFEYLEKISLYCQRKNQEFKAYRLKQAPLAER